MIWTKVFPGHFHLWQVYFALWISSLLWKNRPRGTEQSELHCVKEFAQGHQMNERQISTIFPGMQVLQKVKSGNFTFEHKEFGWSTGQLLTFYWKEIVHRVQLLCDWHVLKAGVVNGEDWRHISEDAKARPSEKWICRKADSFVEWSFSTSMLVGGSIISYR